MFSSAFIQAFGAFLWTLPPQVTHEDPNLTSKNIVSNPLENIPIWNYD